MFVMQLFTNVTTTTIITGTTTGGTGAG
ncbi:hypothetical protein GNY84_02420 [Aeromonas hydrophila]|nr:hypothetical protein [Aeromonas hydrophila]QIF46650.1 hypothetical protein EO082_16495 [Aeromonas veronii]MBQ4715762.1 hypothetical protein [Aeromonas hydrophila]MBW3824178.1 hypothetical protein [Aeromonas hydrophila]MBW5267591.1 hypothetical protein [Aeromonas hydrophila]